MARESETVRRRLPQGEGEGAWRHDCLQARPRGPLAPSRGEARAHEGQAQRWGRVGSVVLERDPAACNGSLGAEGEGPVGSASPSGAWTRSVERRTDIE